jgi:hypothetical protein
MRLLHKNNELKDPNMSLLDYRVRSGEQLLIKPSHQLAKSMGLIESYQIFRPGQEPREVIALLEEVESGFRSEQLPRLAEEGTSGTYFISNCERQVVAIFKPFD